MQADGRTDGQTDMTKLIVVFRNLANAPEKRGNPEIFNQDRQHSDEIPTEYLHTMCTDLTLYKCAGCRLNDNFKRLQVSGQRISPKYMPMQDITE